MDVWLFGSSFGQWLSGDLFIQVLVHLVMGLLLFVLLVIGYLVEIYLIIYLLIIRSFPLSFVWLSVSRLLVICILACLVIWSLVAR